MEKFYTLDSGLRLVFIPNTTVRSVSIGIFVNNGVVCEEESQVGISHFIEHMLFNGTKNRTAYDIVKETDSIGAIINAFTTKYYTCFHTKSLDEHFEQCVDILSDMYFNPLFADKDIVKERKVIYEEIKESLDDVSDICFNITSNKYFNGHNYGREILGSKKTLKNINREEILAFYNKYYTLENTVVSVCGNVSEEKVLDAIKLYFESHKIKNSKPLTNKINNHEIINGYIKKEKSSEQTQIVMMFPSYSMEDKKQYIATILSTMLGGGMSSRLYQNIRDKLGLCYSIGASASSLPGDGAFIITMSTSPTKTKQALESLKKEIDKVIKYGFDEFELNIAKEQEKAAIVFAQESTNYLMRSFGRSYLNGMELSIDDDIKYLNSINMDDVKDCIKETFDYNKMVIGIVGPDLSIDIDKIF